MDLKEAEQILKDVSPGDANGKATAMGRIVEIMKIEIDKFDQRWDLLQRLVNAQEERAWEAEQERDKAQANFEHEENENGQLRDERAWLCEVVEALVCELVEVTKGE